MNNFLVQQGERGGSWEHVEALEKQLQRFASGHNIANDRLKRDLWRLLEYEGALTASDFPDEIGTATINLANFFRQREKPHASFSLLARRYYVFKRSNRRPDQVVVKYLMDIEPSPLSENIFTVRETHVNRTDQSDPSEPIFEDWDGMGFVRRNAIFVVLRENVHGTPRAYTIHSPQIGSHNKAEQMYGDSIESVENWGNSATNYSRLFFQAVPEELDRDEALRQCDLLPRRSTQRGLGYIIRHLYGEDYDPREEE